MRNIFIFNPETDYALASGRTHYNPPAKIVVLRKQLQLVQAHIATPGDIIVVSDDFSPAAYSDKTHLKLVEEKGIQLIKLNQLADLILANDHSTSELPNYRRSDFIIRPWGWNHSLRRQLLDAHIDEGLLKTDDEIDTLRQLSHRRTTIPFQQYLQNSLPTLEIPIAQEFFTVDEAMEFATTCGKTFFKAPWSSSGRGIVRYDAQDKGAASLTEQKLREWIGGFIRKQGSVMGERAFDRIADFATEWMISDGRVDFLGLSLFNTTSEGRYLGNRHLTQEEIDTTLKALTPHWSNDVMEAQPNNVIEAQRNDIIEAQRQALLAIIAPGYFGPVGIDMLIATDGTLNPCVEINLRHTMGIIALHKYSV